MLKMKTYIFFSLGGGGGGGGGMGGGDGGETVGRDQGVHYLAFHLRTETVP